MEKKKLFRSNSDKVLGGVCGGLGEFFNIDSTIIRILFILFFFIGGSSILVYIISLIIIPLNPEYPEEKTEKKSSSFGFYAGIVLVLLGLMLFLNNIGLIPFRIFHFSWDILFSILLIVLGIFFILRPEKIMRDNERMVKRLYKSHHEKMIFGVCSGIGQYLNIDPTFIRLFWIFFTFASFGISIVLYLTLALVLPNDKYVEKEIM